jgi:Protein of unknown function (DUF1236)
MRRSKLIIGLIGAAAAWPLMALAQPAGSGQKHNLSLTHAQRSEIWHALRKQAGKTQEPAGLHVGEAVPDTMRVLSFEHGLRKRIREIRHYRYALLHDRVLIVDPATKKIIAIVRR